MKKISNDRRAISAVISTVIIVAVTIAVAIAVAYWMGGLATIFTRFEKVEVKNALVIVQGSDYNISLTFVNTGATATSIDMITLNGVPTDSYGAGAITLGGDTTVLPLTVEIGVQHTLSIKFVKGLADPSGNQLNPGVTCTVDLHSTGGKDYYTSVSLP